MQKIIPYLWFDHQAEEAARLYTSLFDGSMIGDITHYGENMPGPEGKVLTVSFQLAGKDFVALNGGPEFSFTPAISFFVRCQTPEQVDRLWENLSQGGMVMMDLGEYPFSEKFGWLADRFGVSWQISLERTPLQIVPFLMFTGKQHGKAEEAIKYYTSHFQNSKIDHIQRYGKDMGEPEGTVMHAAFTLDGVPFMASDSGYEHGFTFTPAISFLVNCLDQAEVDYFWNELSTGGATSQCGWLEDRYGVSWQIVPMALGEMMADPDAERAARVTQAMLQMEKLDIGQLRQAYEQA